MRNFKREIAETLARLELGLGAGQIEEALETPPSRELGDYAFPCFPLARTLRKNPAIIAQEIAQAIDADFLEKVETKGAYLNFFISPAAIAETTLTEVFRRQNRYGATEQGRGQHVCIEFSSTNIAKPFHIGHIRSTVQGDALAAIYEFLGYETVRINYLGDYGTQFGMLIRAFQRWGDETALSADPIANLLALYVRYNEEMGKDPALREEARASFAALERGEETEMALWKRFKELSLQEFQRIYELLEIRFDSWDGEYFHSQFIPQVLEELREKNLLIEDDGAMIVPLSEDIPPAMILKSNGTSTYLVRDIATALYRKRTYDFVESIYVVGTQQSLHFRQLKEVLAKMGHTWAKEVHHVGFGMISLQEGSMSTRSGRVVFLEDVLNQAIEKTAEIMAARNPDLENRAQVAREVGIGAVKFQELYNNRIKDYTFSWEDVLNFDGETGPYVQYSCARANRIVERAEGELGMKPCADVDFSLLTGEEEKNLVRVLYDFPQVIQQAKERKEPSLITRHTAEIAKAFNKFYHQSPVFQASTPALSAARLALTAATATVIRVGLQLLGIHAPERM
uniref:arginine--tRNA ligase n=1 Tax=Ndongobacter massiliensis TaxID=1871025 RepID=UPI00093136CD|nr:arginine--tRNA ligase [Ndongobacter massiliensis]